MSKASFLRHCLLVLLVAFVILCFFFKQELVICLLFCKSLLAVTLSSFKKLVKKHSRFVNMLQGMLHTITYSESLSHTCNLDDLGIYFLRIHFSFHLTFLFFMDLIIFFGNLDGSRSLSRFTCLTILEWQRNTFAQDGGKATTMFIIARNVLLKLFLR